jgi:hypothetical protein
MQQLLSPMARGDGRMVLLGRVLLLTLAVGAAMSVGLALLLLRLHGAGSCC